MSVIGTAALGLAAGVIASLVTPGRRGPFGFMLTSLLGIIGAFAAAYLGQEAGWYQAEDSTGLIAALLGAAILLLIWGLLFRSRRPTSSV
ncbi:GlsB/YeaQ/YmgE family stress response membrane protein [Microvirga tunisiensis]|uniref:GlsB/YeaQ/YmgE family stress response membrane protein n=1 Tax=Microvirga tunisiensis TaxID=2108360 RepID=A0A5N7MS44_9HYPH|nr:GlsB/YeaQ/YmgE family stress response membrane protein [Microvirga tunisiensis]MPR11466.1 GlsB/YeaQ/YmgE family stress response membrane protein [Microvirga tunisiensis]MPR29480.1 GlsB/YeaQ/YmgE family stress response membrane protein [Microvirga tunisiensis]